MRGEIAPRPGVARLLDELKPHPAADLVALSELRVRPARAVAIEDSRGGLDAPTLQRLVAPSAVAG